MYLNSLNQQLFSNSINNNFLKTHTLTWPSFNNLNLFENSRLWIFKKYFFNNNQSSNLVVNSSKFTLDTNKNLNNFSSNTHSIKYNEGLYIMNISHILHNNTTPSLSINCSLVDFTNHSKAFNTHINKNLIKVNTPQLDIVSGYITNFLYTMTSNTNLNNIDTFYFNPINCYKNPLKHKVT
jgi:hypothetical protein